MKISKLILAGIFALLTWNGTYAQTDEEYDAALAAIQDGMYYRISTEYAGTTYYLTWDGYLSEVKDQAGVFNFRKVEGDEYGYGFILKDASAFSNPPLLTNTKVNFNTGRISVYGVTSQTPALSSTV